MSNIPESINIILVNRSQNLIPGTNSEDNKFTMTINSNIAVKELKRELEITFAKNGSSVNVFHHGRKIENGEIAVGKLYEENNIGTNNINSTSNALKLDFEIVVSDEFCTSDPNLSSFLKPLSISRKSGTNSSKSNNIESPSFDEESAVTSISNSLNSEESDHLENFTNNSKFDKFPHNQDSSLLKKSKTKRGKNINFSIKNNVNQICNINKCNNNFSSNVNNINPQQHKKISFLKKHKRSSPELHYDDLSNNFKKFRSFIEEDKITGDLEDGEIKEDEFKNKKFAINNRGKIFLKEEKESQNRKINVDAFSSSSNNSDFSESSFEQYVKQKKRSMSSQIPSNSNVTEKKLNSENNINNEGGNCHPIYNSSNFVNIDNNEEEDREKMNFLKNTLYNSAGVTQDVIDKTSQMIVNSKIEMNLNKEIHESGYQDLIDKKKFIEEIKNCLKNPPLEKKKWDGEFIKLENKIEEESNKLLNNTKSENSNNLNNTVSEFLTDHQNLLIPKEDTEFIKKENESKDVSKAKDNNLPPSPSSISSSSQEKICSINDQVDGCTEKEVQYINLQADEDQIININAMDSEIEQIPFIENVDLTQTIIDQEISKEEEENEVKAKSANEIVFIENVKEDEECIEKRPEDLKAEFKDVFNPVYDITMKDSTQEEEVKIPSTLPGFYKPYFTEDNPDEDPDYSSKLEEVDSLMRSIKLNEDKKSLMRMKNNLTIPRIKNKKDVFFNQSYLLFYLNSYPLESISRRLDNKEFKINIVLDIDSTIIFAETISRDILANTTEASNYMPTNDKVFNSSFEKEEIFFIKPVINNAVFTLKFKIRKYVIEFIQRVSRFANLYIHTHGQEPYAKEVIKIINTLSGVGIKEENICAAKTNIPTQKTLKDFSDEKNFLSNSLILDDNVKAWMNEYHDNIVQSMKYQAFFTNAAFNEQQVRTLEQGKMTFTYLLSYNRPQDCSDFYFKFIDDNNVPFSLEYDFSKKFQIQSIIELIENVYKLVVLKKCIIFSNFLYSLCSGCF